MERHFVSHANFEGICCWRVGNGESIKVTTNKWILNYPSNNILHPVHEEEEGWTVSDLIDSNRHWWVRHNHGNL